MANANEESTALVWKSVRITAGSISDLERLAEKDDRSVSFLIRRAIEQYINRRAL